ncbi:hypothetical protein AOQ84DRAFT_423299 [Glonium stellatum]|uniref:Uncharacterized protein n=1 Tax=Glonium stellatum TaxID=574774 RepID=A0A8E2JW98_9PEZI|nr:hypothetical protein AOQ84DRAFT_423299 [Glonium stellatum]
MCSVSGFFVERPDTESSSSGYAGCGDNSLECRCLRGDFLRAYVRHASLLDRRSFGSDWQSLRARHSLRRWLMARPPPYAACYPMISEDIHPLCGNRPNNGPLQPAKYRRDKGQTRATQRPCNSWWLVQRFLKQRFRYCPTKLGLPDTRRSTTSRFYCLLLAGWLRPATGAALLASPKSDVKAGYGKVTFAVSGLNSSAACKATRISLITDRNNRARGRGTVLLPGEIFCSSNGGSRIPESQRLALGEQAPHCQFLPLLYPKLCPTELKRSFRATYPHIIAYHLPSLPAVAHASRANAVPLPTSTPPSRRARGPFQVITPPESNCKQPRPKNALAPLVHRFRPFEQTCYAGEPVSDRTIPAGCIPRQYLLVALASCTRKRESLPSRAKSSKAATVWITEAYHALSSTPIHSEYTQG